jgi:hypothetical protein
MSLIPSVTYKPIMMRVVVLNVVMLGVVMLGVIMLGVVMLSIAVPTSMADRIVTAHFLFDASNMTLNLSTPSD